MNSKNGMHSPYFFSLMEFPSQASKLDRSLALRFSHIDGTTASVKPIQSAKYCPIKTEATYPAGTSQPFVGRCPLDSPNTLDAPGQFLP